VPSADHRRAGLHGIETDLAYDRAGFAARFPAVPDLLSPSST
jgi:hypothetical protein